MIERGRVKFNGGSDLGERFIESAQHEQTRVNVMCHRRIGLLFPGALTGLSMGAAQVIAEKFP